MKANTTLSTITHTKPLTAKALLALDHIAADDDNPITTDDDWTEAIIKSHGKVIGKTRGKQKTKATITLRLDPKIIDYFKADGKGYQTRINQALLDYIAHHSP